MRGIAAIIKKELTSYFYSPVAYVVYAAFFSIMGIIFATFISIYQQQAFDQRMGRPSITLDQLMSGFYQNMGFVMLFLLPFITMRLFAEEKRQATMELLLTAPLRTGELVIGKFLSALCMLGILALITLFYVFFVVMWGKPDLGTIATTYLGLILFTGCYLAVGALLSAVTDSQAVAAILAYTAFLVLWLLSAIGQNVNLKLAGVEVGELLQYLSPLSHYGEFAKGLIQAKDAVYFLSFIGFFLFMTHRVVDSHRWR